MNGLKEDIRADYNKGKQVRCVEGSKTSTLREMGQVIRVDEQAPHPMIKKHFGNRPRLNVEYILVVK